jgi:hypothetical protein
MKHTVILLFAALPLGRSSETSKPDQGNEYCVGVVVGRKSTNCLFVSRRAQENKAMSADTLV